MSSIRLKHASGNSMSLAAPGTNPASNLELKLPHTIGSANQLLKVDGSGQLGWATDSTTDSTKLPLAGGTLTGTLNIGNGSITTGSNFSLNGNALTVTGTSTVVGEFKRAGSPTIQCTDTTNNTDLQLRANSTGGLVRTASNHPLVFGTNQQERVRIDSSGKLGLGVTNPARELHLKTAGNCGIRIEGGTNHTCQVLFTPAGGTEHQGRIGYFQGNDAMDFYTAGAERLVIDSTGHLHIKGQDHEIRWYRDDGNRYGAITYDGGNFNIKNPVNDHTRICKSDGTEIVKFNNNKNVYIADGDLVISTSGHGINFSATSDGPSQGNETLDDYERGTYTPQGLAWSGSDWATVTFDSISRYGRYTKIGGLVHVQGYLSNFHVDSSFDNQLAGITLPFAAVSASYHYSVGVTTHSTAFSSSGYTTFFVNPATSNMYSMQENTTSYNTWSGSSGRYLMFQVSYMCE